MSKAGRRRAKRAGRKRDPEAVRHQTTRAGRAGAEASAERQVEALAPIEGLIRRLEIAGIAVAPLRTAPGETEPSAERQLEYRRHVEELCRRHGAEKDVVFPPDALLDRGWISEDMRDEGVRFAVLAWWLYGLPFSGPELLYERVASGVVDVDLAPRRELILDDPEGQRIELERIQSNKARFMRMIKALGGFGEGGIETIRLAGKLLWYRQQTFFPIRGTPFDAVRNATQFLRFPRLLLLIDREGGTRERPEAADYLEMARLVEGLRRLVRLRSAEDRHYRRRRAAAVKALLSAGADTAALR